MRWDVVGVRDGCVVRMTIAYKALLSRNEPQEALVKSNGLPMCSYCELFNHFRIIFRISQITEIIYANTKSLLDSHSKCVVEDLRCQSFEHLQLLLLFLSSLLVFLLFWRCRQWLRVRSIGLNSGSNATFASSFLCDLGPPTCPFFALLSKHVKCGQQQSCCKD